MLADGREQGDDATFLRSVLALGSIDRVPELLARALALVTTRSHAREAYLEVLTDTGVETSEIASEGCSEERVAQIQTIVSRGIIGEAMATGRTVETADAGTDPRFLDRESVQRHSIEAVLCVPIGRDVPVGVIYLQGRAEGSGEFQPFSAELRADVETIAEMLALTITHATETRPVRIRDGERGRGEDDRAFDGVVCHSDALAEVVQKLKFAAKLDVHVLLTGPSGSGKTQLAQAMHRASPRRAAPFVELNCAAIPETLLENELFGADPGAHSAVPRGGVKGKVEMAEGGTLFLDEVGELPLLAQAKILQLLQSKTYYRLGSSSARTANVRIIAATNVQLKQAVAEKRFREDLFYRLKVLEVKVPGLSERKADVVPLARHFLRLAAERHDLGPKTLTPAALRTLQSIEWLGNVRELAHQVEAAALSAELRRSDRVEPRDLAGESSSGEISELEALHSLHDATRAFQKKHVQTMLERSDWNMTETARILDISRAHIYTLVRSFELKR